MKPVNKALRENYLDNISGVLILDMVIIIHVCPNCNIQNNITHIIWQLFCYFIAWFFFKSGMFYKPKTIPLTNGIKKLIIPYFIFTLVGLVVHVVFCYIANEESLLRILLNCKESIVYRGGEEWNLALWFLVSLFFARITTSILSKIIPILIIFIISGAAAYGVHFLKLTYPVWIGNIFLGVFFYTMGYILRDIQYNKFFFYFSFLLFVFGLFFPVITKFDFRCNQVGIADNYPIVLLYCTFGIITINNLAYKFLNKPIRLITMIGKNSIIICVIHFPILMLSTNIARIMSITKPYYIFTIASISISIIAYLSLIILRSNKFGFMIGR